MPWVDPDKVGPIRWDAHLEGLLVFLLPGVLSMGSILYGLAFWRRSHRAAIAGGVALFFLFFLTDLFLTNLDLRRVAFWADPFGLSYVAYVTRYWTPWDMNTRLVPLTSAFLVSRLLWAGIPLLGLMILARRFRMHLHLARASKRPPESPSTPASPPAYIPAMSPTGSWFQTFLAHLHLALRLLFTSYVFWVLAAVFGVTSLVNLLFMVFFGKAYDLLMMPTTAAVLNMMGDNVFLLLVILLTVFAGELLHRDREQRTLEWIAVTPRADLAFDARVLALGLALLLVLGGFVLLGVAFQIAFATPIRFATYGGWVLLLMAAPVFPYLALAFFLHTLLPRKILGHLLLLAFFLFILFAESFHVEKAVFYYGLYPGFLEPLSDITGLAPLLPHVLPWMLLWGLAGALLLLLARRYARGPSLEPFRIRLQRVVLRSPRGDLGVALLVGIAFAGLWGWMYWDIYVKRPWMGTEALHRAYAAYEKRYKRFQLAPIPRMVHIEGRVDLFPSSKAYRADLRAVYVNRDTLPVESLLVEYAGTPPFEVEHLEVSRTYEVVDSGAVLPWVALWRFSPPLAPGETLVITTRFRCTPPIPGPTRVPCDLTPRGGLLHLAPPVGFGYDPGKELASRRLRRKHGLPPEKIEIPPDTPRADFQGFSRFTFAVTLSLPQGSDLEVVSGGKVVRRWEADGRRFVAFQADTPAIWGIRALVFALAPYRVYRDTLGDIRLELYAHPDHVWNVDTVLAGAKAALRYHIRHFGPYPHRVLRIAEFPLIFGDYAQSLAGFIPYGESMGFLQRMVPGDIPFPVFVIAHEVGHQWWAHQLTPAWVLGATFITESFSEYVAIRVMETGRDPAVRRKFLKHELDRYLRHRRGLVRHERPVVVSTEPSVYYRKGAVITYATASLLGHDAYAGILRDLLEAFPDPPPHPSVRDYLDRLYARAPDSLVLVLRDWHERVVLYDLVAREARRRRDTLVFTIEARKRAVEGETEEAVAFREPVDVGLFAGDTLKALRRIWIRDGVHPYALFPVPEGITRVEVDPLFERVNLRWEDRGVEVR